MHRIRAHTAYEHNCSRRPFLSSWACSCLFLLLASLQYTRSAAQLIITGQVPPVVNSHTRQLLSTATRLKFNVITTGRDHACAVTSSSKMYCWGNGSSGKLGTSAGVSASEPAAAAIAATVSTASAGDEHSCAVMLNGDVYCWGANGNGQVGDGTLFMRSEPVKVSGLSSAMLVAAGGAHTCAVLSNSGMYCWGKNGDGQVGDGSTVLRLSPSVVQGNRQASSIAAGGSHTCAVVVPNVPYCWGNNDRGQLGIGNTRSQNKPSRVKSISVTSVAAGAEFTCAIDPSGQAYCWGSNEKRQLGNGGTGDESQPAAVQGLLNAVAITAGQQHACAVTGAGTVLCWGANSAGQLGVDSTTSYSVPTLVSSLQGQRAVAAGGSFTCALGQNASTHCWGSSDSGQIADGSSSGQRLLPRPVRSSYVAGRVVAVVPDLDGSCSPMVDLQLLFSVLVWPDLLNTSAVLGCSVVQQVGSSPSQTISLRCRKSFADTAAVQADATYLLPTLDLDLAASSYSMTPIAKLSVVDTRVQADGTLQVAVGMRVCGETALALTSLSVVLWRGASQWPCTSPAWRAQNVVLQCEAPAEGAMQVSIAHQAATVNATGVLHAPLRPTLLTASPSQVYPALSGSARNVTVTVTGQDFGKLDVSQVSMAVGLVPCAAVHQVSALQLQCVLRAPALLSLLGSTASVSVRLPAPAGLTASASQRTATLASAVSVVRDSQAPRGVVATAQIALLAPFEYTLVGAIFDDVSSAADLQVAVDSASAFPSTLGSSFSYPLPGSTVSLQDFLVSTAGAAEAGTLQLRIRLLDDAGNSDARTLTITVVNTVTGSLVPAGDTAGASPFPSSNDTLCVRATFDRAVSGIASNDLQLTANWYSNSTPILGWAPTSVTLRNSSTTAYDICAEVSNLASGALLRIRLPASAGHAAEDAEIGTQELSVSFVRDTQAPALTGPLCSVVRADDVNLFAALVPFRCTLLAASAADDVTASADVVVQGVQLVDPTAGNLTLQSAGVGVKLSSQPGIAGSIARAGVLLVNVSLRDAAGNVGFSIARITVWEASAWAPSIHGIEPAVLPVTGGLLTLRGANFTALALDGIGVLVQGRACTVQETASTYVTCQALPGFGANATVSVTAPGNVNVTSMLRVSYAAPGISSVETQPGSSLMVWSNSAPISSAALQAVRISCTSCGGQDDLISAVYVGGMDCADPHFESAGVLVCTPQAHQANLSLVHANGTAASVFDASMYVHVQVCIVDQCSPARALPALGAPVLAAVAARRTDDGHHVVEAGDQVTVSGWALGRTAADIVAVYVGDVESPAFTRLSAESLSITVPAAPSPGVQQLLPVRVRTAAGWLSAPVPGVSLSFRSAYNAERAPQVAVQALSIMRAPSSMAQWQLSFRVPHDENLDLVPADSILLRWRAGPTAPWQQAISVDISQFFRQAVSASRALAAGMATQYSATISDARLPATAVLVSLAVANVGGTGPWLGTPALMPAALSAVGVSKVVASRTLGQPGVVTLAVHIPYSPQLAAFPAQQLQVYLASAGTLDGALRANASLSLPQALTQQGIASTLQVSDLSMKELPGQNVSVYTAELTRVSTAPMRFGVSIVSAAGIAPVRILSTVLYDLCTVQQYLRTELAGSSLDAVQCAACPAGAWCGGGTYDSLMPLQGWQRISWTPFALSLARCPVETSCPGVPPAATASANTNLTGAAALTQQYRTLLASYDVVGAAATGINASGDSQCTTGYHGVICRACAVGYAQSRLDGTCSPCKSLALHVFLLLLMLMAVAVGVGYLIVSTIRVGRNEDNRLTSGLKKLLFSHSQQVSLAIGFDFAWPTVVSELLNALDMASNLSDSVVATDCLVSSSSVSAFRLRIIGILIAPWLLVGLIFAVWIGAYWEARKRCLHRVSRSLQSRVPCCRRFCQCCCRPCGPCKPTPPSSAVSTPGRATPQPSPANSISSVSSRAALNVVHRGHHSQVTGAVHQLNLATLSKWRNIQQFMVVSVVVVCFIMHTSVTKAALRQFSCVVLPGDPTGVQVLADDYSVECLSGENRVWIFGLGVPGFLLYGLGMPLLLWTLTWRHRGDLQEDRVKAKLGFLYMSYKPHAWYFEPVMMLRKALLATISVNLAPLGLSMQAYAAILLLFLALLLHMNLKPMANKYLQRMEQVSLTLSVLTLLGGLFLNASGTEGMNVMVSFVIVLGNGGFMVYIVYKLVRLYLAQLKMPQLGTKLVRAYHRRMSKQPVALTRIATQLAAEVSASASWSTGSAVPVSCSHADVADPRRVSFTFFSSPDHRAALRYAAGEDSTVRISSSSRTSSGSGSCGVDAGVGVAVSSASSSESPRSLGGGAGAVDDETSQALASTQHSADDMATSDGQLTSDPGCSNAMPSASAIAAR